MKKVLQKSTTVWLLLVCQLQGWTWSSTVNKIMGAEDTVLSYRIISHLLLGIVRIYSRKVEYLEYDSDCLLSKLQQQFGRCRGSTNATFGPSSTITIPKQLQLDAFNLDIVVDESRDYMSNIEISLFKNKLKRLNFTPLTSW